MGYKYFFLFFPKVLAPEMIFLLFKDGPVSGEGHLRVQGSQGLPHPGSCLQRCMWCEARAHPDLPLWEPHCFQGRLQVKLAHFVVEQQ